jgi:hypothetical protein
MAVEHLAGMHKLVEIPLDYVLHELVRSPASALQSAVLELLFRLGGEMNFHGFGSVF